MMKKLLFALIAAVALFVTVSAYANDVMPIFRDNESVELQFEFQYNTNMLNTIDLYTSRIETGDDAGQPVLSSKFDTDNDDSAILDLGDQGMCLRDINMELAKFYMVVEPHSLFDVAIYTNNIPAVVDANNDSYVDGTFDGFPDCDTYPDFKGHRIPYPAPWAQKTTLQRAQWIGEKAGIPHIPYKWALLALKIWSQGNTGASFDNEGGPGDGFGEYKAPVTTSGEILDVDWTGDLVQFTYIPEKLAVDMDEEQYPGAYADPDPWGSYKKLIAGTIFGTNIYEAQEISIAANLLKTGKGDYKGTLYFDLRTN